MNNNILLVVMDCVRVKNTTIGGYDRDTTPFLSELASESVVYTQTRAPGNWTTPSHMSMFTGYDVAELGADTTKEYRLPPEETFWTSLSADGYDTAVMSFNPNLTKLPNGLSESFDTVVGSQDLIYPNAVDPREYVDGRPQIAEWLQVCLSSDKTVKSLINGLEAFIRSKGYDNLTQALDSNSTTSPYVDRFLDWETNRSGPWAACLNLMDAHEPYYVDDRHAHWSDDDLLDRYRSLQDTVWPFYGGEVPWRYREAFEDLYDGAIKQIDSKLERLVDALEQRGVLDKTLLIITSDHGECFGDYSRLAESRLAEHGIGVHEALTHVPLVVRPPGGSAGTTVDRPATPTKVPEAVAHTTNGNSFDETVFTPEEPVISTSIVPRSAVSSPLAPYERSPADLCGTAHAVYTESDNRIIKHGQWDNRDQITTVADLNTSTNSDFFHNRLEQIDDLSILEWKDTLSDVSTDTEQRLEDLGYL